MTQRLVPILACSLVLGCGGAEPSTSDDSVGTGDTGTSDTGSTDTSDTSSTDTTDTTGDESCATPLPPEAMNPDNQLAFGIFFGGLELEIGSSLQFQVGLVQCCVFWDPLETWAFLSWLALAAALHARATVRPSPATFGVWLGLVFVLAFLTFFGVPFISTVPHKGAV